jgi:hypothetical protein
MLKAVDQCMGGDWIIVPSSVLEMVQTELRMKQMQREGAKIIKQIEMLKDGGARARAL